METENSNLKSRLKQLEAQANKYFHLKLQKDVMDKRIFKLQAEMVQRQRSIRKLKSKTVRYHKDILEKSTSLKKMEYHLKKIWSLLLILGNKLRKNDLLTMEEKDKIKMEYEEWFTLLVSQDNRKTEEVLEILNDLPISLFEVLDDSDKYSEIYNSKHDRTDENKKKNVLLSNSNKELNSKNWNNNFSSLECDRNNLLVTSPKLSDDELSDHNITTSPSISEDDSDTDSNILDIKSLELKAYISSNHYNNELVKSIPNKPFNLASNQNNFDVSNNLEDHLVACDVNEPELTAYKLNVSDEQKVSVNVDTNLQTDSMSSQMPQIKNCVLDAANASTLCSSSLSNLNSLDLISEKNSVGSKNVIDNSKCDSTNSPLRARKISTARVQDSKIAKKKMTLQSNEKIRKMVYDNSFSKNRNTSFLLSSTSFQGDKSLNQSKENNLLQNESALKDSAKIKRTTIMLPGPPLKISRKSKQGLHEKKDSKMQDISCSLQQNLSYESSVKRVQQPSSCSLHPKKKPKIISNKGISDMAPVRVRGRTLINRRPLKKKKNEVESIAEVNECNDESQVLEGKPMPEFNFVSTSKPNKVRKEHKGKLSNDDFKNKKNVDKTKLICEENENPIDTEKNVHKNVSEKLEFNNENIVNDLLKEAELHNIKKDSKLQSLPLVQYFKLNAKDKNLYRINVSKGGILLKKGITRFQKQKSKAFISNINKYHCTNKIQRLKTKKKSKCHVNNDFIQEKYNASNTDKRLKTELSLIISEKEIQKDIIPRHMQDNSSELATEIKVPDTMNSVSLTLIKENTLLDSEVTSSIENVKMSPIERKGMQYAIKCDSGNTTDLAFKDLGISLNNIDLKKDCISENNSDFEGNEKLYAKSIHSNKIHCSSSENMEVDNEDKKYISTCDSDSESPLVIDEDFGVEQCIVSEEKHDKPQDKNKISKNEYNDYLDCINVNVSEHIKKELNSLVCTQNVSNFSNTCETADKISKKEITSSSTDKKEFISLQSVSFTPSLTSAKVDIVVKCKPKIKKCLNEQRNGSPACKKIGLIPKIVEKSVQEKSPLTLSCSSKSNKNGKNKKNIIRHKLNKRKFSPNNNHCKVTESIPEKFFEEFQSIEFNEENLKQNTKNLFNFLLNPSHSPNNSALLFHVLNYLQDSKKNLLLAYSVHEDVCALFPLDESCIVETLFMIESKKKLYLDGLINSAVTTIHHLIICNKKCNIYGLASLCRVFTAICKEEGYSLKPIILCGEILKMKHDFAPYLIASIAGVWKELFNVDSDSSAEEALYHSCILYGASKRPKKLCDSNWKSSMEFISKYFTALPINDARKVIDDLKEIINVRCENDTWDNIQYLSSAMIILAAYQDWEWTKENLLTKHIIPNLNKYGRETLNEKAFDLFCNLYVDTILLTPANSLDTVLREFFTSSTNQDGSFVRDSTALALMKFAYLKNRKLPPFLSSWHELNKENPKVKCIELNYGTSIVESLSVLQET